MESNWELEFMIPGNPVALKRHRTVKVGKFTKQYDPSEGDKGDFLAKAMQVKPDVPFDEPLKVNMHFFFKRPKAHFRTGKDAGFLKDSAPKWHTNIPDVDNLVKFVCDSLNGVFWLDDKCICELTALKEYSTYPKIIIRIGKAK